MKYFILFLLFPIVFACSDNNKKATEKIKSSDIEGNWLCLLPQEYDEVEKVNLYLKNGVCHFGDFQDNRTSYFIKSNLLIVKDHLGHVYQAKIVEAKSDVLKLKLLSKWRNQFSGSDLGKDSEITFYRMKIKNNLLIRQVNFARYSGYSMSSPVYGFQFTSSMDFLFEGVQGVEDIGFFTGKTNQQFWNILLDKLRYIDIAKMKGTVGARNAADVDWIDLEVKTAKGRFSCNFLDHRTTPAAYLSLHNYVNSNFEQFKYKPLNVAEFLKSGGTPQHRFTEGILNFIPC